MTIPDQDKIKKHSFFFLYSIDHNMMVLGNAKTEDESTTLFLYDKDKDRFLEFSKTN
jgi:hypothetical protein